MALRRSPTKAGDTITVNGGLSEHNRAYYGSVDELTIE
jgi:hypothetical protein